MLQLRPYQSDAVDRIRQAYQSGYKAPLLVLPTGGGKCLAAGTPILMFDGSIKPVEKIAVGDLLMGPDSKPRKVLSTCTGREQMYRVNPIKGDAYTVNESHILSLKISGSMRERTWCGGVAYVGGQIANVTVRDYLAASNTFKHRAKGWRTGVDFEAAVYPLSHDPYFIGLWLGDGTSRYSSITTGDAEVKQWILKYAADRGERVRVEPNSENSEVLHIVGDNHTGRGGSIFNNALRAYGLIGNKHIPMAYKTASREDRLKLLAGIIDTDGYYDGKQYSLTLKSERLLDDVIFVARSLGFAAYKRKVAKTCTNNGKVGVYYTCHIGGDIDQVPVLIPRKKAHPRRQKKNVLVTGITVEPVGYGDYYGFEIDGDRLFLLGDFTVTHNTVVFSHIAATSSARGKRVLILVHRVELLRQTAAALRRAGINPGLVNPLYTPAYRQPVQVAMVQTMVKRTHYFPKGFDLIITDEAHHAVSSTYRKILDTWPEAFQLGVTATPVRGDGKGLGQVAGGVFDTMVIGPTVADLISGGYLVKPAIFAPRERLDLSGVRVRMGDYDKGDLEKAMDKPSITGNAVEHYRRTLDGQPAVAFCVSVKHAEHVAAEFQAAGYRAYAVDGGMDNETRTRILNGLANGQVQVVTSCDIISEGTDIPAIAGAILLRPTQSTGLYLQQVGRALRPMPGKERAVILDHVGNVLTHGLPDEDREWSLDGEEKRGKKKKKDKEQPQSRVQQCVKCYAVFEADADACPCCGHPVEKKKGRQVDTKEGELRQITDADRAALRRKQSKEVGRARTLEHLEQIAKERGYKPGWAKHVFNSRNRDKDVA